MNKDKIAMALITQGSFIDQPSQNGPKYYIEASVYRLNYAACNAWRASHFHRYSDEKLAAYKKIRALTLRYLGLPDKGVTLTPSDVGDILTVVQIHEAKADAVVTPYPTAETYPPKKKITASWENGTKKYTYYTHESERIVWQAELLDWCKANKYRKPKFTIEEMYAE